jgi:hypothetical protein
MQPIFNSLIEEAVITLLVFGRVVSVTPRPRFTPGERTPSIHCTGGWVGLRASQDTEAKSKNPFASTGDRTSIARSSSP